jgi:uroporphyrinogen-III decarboxylase
MTVPMTTTRCNLNVSVVSAWWEQQLGLPPQTGAAEKQAALQKAFPGLITFDNATLPRPVPDPNRGFTLLKALGLEVTPDAHDGPAVTPVSPEQAMALTPPDFAANPAIDALRQAIRETRRLHGRVAPGGIAGLLYPALKIRGQDLFCDFYEHPGMVHHLMAVLGETLYRYLVFLKDECGEIPYFVLGSCSNCMISPATYQEFLLIHEARVSMLSPYIKGRARAMGVHHCGTKADAYFSVYGNLPGLEMIEANWDTDMDLGLREIPGLLFKPMLDPILLDRMREDEIEEQLIRLLEHPQVIEVQAFDLSQFCTVNKLRRMLGVTLDYNRRHGLPGYTRFFA